MIKQFTSFTQQKGEKGEQAAVTHLQKEGFVIVERNVPNKYGEIDIVARKGRVTHFFEVKTGMQESWFNPADNMSETKIKKFLVSVQYYCLVHRVKECRVTLLLVKLPRSPGKDPTIELLPLP